MSKVVKFPTKDPATGLVTQLRTRMQELDSIYDRLEQAHGLLNTLEQVAAESERDFDKCLTDYARMVGAENIEVQMLQYSQNTKAVPDESGKTWQLEWEDSDET